MPLLSLVGSRGMCPKCLLVEFCLDKLSWFELISYVCIFILVVMKLLSTLPRSWLI